MGRMHALAPSKQAASVTFREFTFRAKPFAPLRRINIKRKRAREPFRNVEEVSRHSHSSAERCTPFHVGRPNGSFRHELFGMRRRDRLRDGILRGRLIGQRNTRPRGVCLADSIAGRPPMNPDSYRQQSVDDAYDAIIVLLASILILGIALYAVS